MEKRKGTLVLFVGAVALMLLVQALLALGDCLPERTARGTSSTAGPLSPFVGNPRDILPPTPPVAEPMRASDEAALKVWLEVFLDRIDAERDELERWRAQADEALATPH